jgi:hypothetical protein
LRGPQRASAQDYSMHFWTKRQRALKGVVNHAIFMLKPIMESTNPVDGVMKTADRIRKSVLIALNRVITQRDNEI